MLAITLAKTSLMTKLKLKPVLFLQDQPFLVKLAIQLMQLIGEPIQVAQGDTQARQALYENPETRVKPDLHCVQAAPFLHVIQDDWHGWHYPGALLK